MVLADKGGTGELLSSEINAGMYASPASRLQQVLRRSAKPASK